MKNKKNIEYLDMLAEYTMLGVKKINSKKCEIFVEYIEPNRASMIDHICNLPGESFEICDNAIAVFSENDGEFELRDVYDLEFHRFVVKDKVDKLYKERFTKNYKVKEKVG